MKKILVAPRSDARFGFARPFFANKLRARKIGREEINLPSPEDGVLFKKAFNKTGLPGFITIGL